MTDAELLEGLVARSREAQVAFWPRCMRRVLPICKRILKDGALAEDVAGDIYLDFVFDHAARLRSPEALDAYLRFMAVRRACRVRDRRATCAELPESRAQEPADAVPVDEAVAEREEAERLRRCLEQLEPRAERMVRLRFAGDRTVAEVGAAVGVSKQYASRVIQQALAALRACMEAVR